MLNRRPYIAESEIKPGCAVVQGSADNKVRGADGAGDFIGLYAFEANENKSVGEEIGIVIAGVAKALAGGTVTAGKTAVLNASGALVNLPDAAGQYSTVGVFLESGFAGEYVDVLIARGCATIV
jgi:hypothetical protein